MKKMVLVPGFLALTLIFTGCGDDNKTQAEMGDNISSSDKVEVCQNAKPSAESGITDATYSDVMNKWAAYTGCKNVDWKTVKTENAERVLFTCRIDGDFTNFAKSGHQIPADVVDHVDVNLSFGVSMDGKHCGISSEQPYDTLVYYKEPVKIFIADRQSVEKNVSFDVISQDLAQVYNVLAK